MLKGKNIVVTGANRGLGKAIINACAEEGANIFACVRTLNAEFETVCNEMEKQYKTRVYPIAVDLKSEEQIRIAAKEILGYKIPIHGIVNNAGIVGEKKLFLMTSTREIMDTMKVNFMAPMHMIQNLVKSMIRSKNGSIVNISSAAALDGDPAQLEYVSSKAAIIGATRKLSIELGAYGIRVNAVAPGVIQTDMIKEMKEEFLEKAIDKTVLKRVGTSEEVAQLVVFLLSDRSSYITGQTIRIDGGIH